MTARGTQSRADRALAPAVVAAAAVALIAMTSIRPDSGPPEPGAVAGPAPFVNPLDVLLTDLTGLAAFLFIESVWGSFLIAVLGVVGYALAAERATRDESPATGPGGERAAAARAAYVDGEIGLVGLERRLDAAIAGDDHPADGWDPSATGTEPIAVIDRSVDELVVSDPETGEVVRTVRLPDSVSRSTPGDGGDMEGDEDSAEGIELRLR